jgi:hypothetical protein
VCCTLQASPAKAICTGCSSGCAQASSGCRGQQLSQARSCSLVQPPAVMRASRSTATTRAKQGCRHLQQPSAVSTCTITACRADCDYAVCQQSSSCVAAQQATHPHVFVIVLGVMLLRVLVRCTLPVHVQVNWGFPHRLSEVHAFLHKGTVGPTSSAIAGSHSAHAAVHTQARQTLLQFRLLHSVAAACKPTD